MEEGQIGHDIVGYDCSETPQSLSHKKQILGLLMKDIRWRSQTKKRVDTKTERLDTVPSKTIDTDKLSSYREGLQHDMENADRLLEKYFSGDISAFDSTLFNEVGEPQEIIRTLKPAPSQVRIFKEVTNGKFTIPSSPDAYGTLVTQTLSTPHILSKSKLEAEQDSFGIFQSHSHMHTEPASQSLHIPPMPISCLVDWVVSASGDEFLQRRYDLLCSLHALNVSDFTPYALTSVNEVNIERRCIIYSDLAEMNVLDLQSLLSRARNSCSSYILSLAKNIYSLNKFTETRREYILKEYDEA